jgi:hypothetical protein
MSDTASGRPDPAYQLYVLCGEVDAPVLADASVVRVSPSGDSLQEVLDAIAASGLTAADLRTRTLFILGSVPPMRAVLCYAALAGFAGRLLDFSDQSEVFEVRPLLAQLHEAPDAGRPEVTDVPVVLDLSTEPIPESFTAEYVSGVRFAKQLAFHPAADAARTLESFVFLAGLRFRSSTERFPAIAGPDGSFVLDLDEMRRLAAAARRERRIDDRGSIVEAVEPDTRRSRLLAAAALPLDSVLRALGSHQDDESGLWRCPRPGRHSNGDANPSARLAEEGFRCFRCDLEFVDPLRLTMDARGLSPDAAADWLLAN